MTAQTNLQYFASQFFRYLVVRDSDRHVHLSETDILDGLHEFCGRILPSGSGFDCGTKFLPDESTQERLTFLVEFHHMDGRGFYSGWTAHKVIVRPSFQFGFTLRVTGRDRNQVKDYIADVFHTVLSQEQTKFDALVERGLKPRQTVAA